MRTAPWPPSANSGCAADGGRGRLRRRADRHRTVGWPAYPSSNQVHALTTVGQVGCLVALLGVGVLLAPHTPGWRGSARPPCWRPSRWSPRHALGATRLYLFGISVDQQFRTEYLTRLTDSPALHDMTYLGLPPFYPPGWFWLGGRAGALTGTPAWEMFKPWAITSIAVAVVLAMVLWAALDPFRVRAADRHHRDRRGRHRLQLSGAVQRDHHRADPAGAGAGLVRAARGTGNGGWAAVVGVGLFPTWASPPRSTTEHCCWPTPRSPSW